MPLQVNHLPLVAAEAAQPLKNALQSLNGSKLARFDSVFVPPQVAAINTAITANGVHFNLALDSIAAAGVISTIGQPVGNVSSLEGLSTAATAPSAMQEAPMLGSASPALSITSLSDLAITYPASNSSNALKAAHANETLIPVFNLGQPLTSVSVQTAELKGIDLSLLPLGSPASFTSLTGAQGKATLIEGAGLSIRMAELGLSQGAIDSFGIATLATLSLAVPAATVTTTAAAEPALMSIRGVQMSNGITVSGTSEATGISVQVTGDSAAMQALMTDLTAMSQMDTGSIALRFTADLTAIALNEAAVSAGVQVRLTGTLTLFEPDMPPGSLILGG